MTDTVPAATVHPNPPAPPAATDQQQQQKPRRKARQQKGTPSPLPPSVPLPNTQQTTDINPALALVCRMVNMDVITVPAGLSNIGSLAADEREPIWMLVRILLTKPIVKAVIGAAWGTSLKRVNIAAVTGIKPSDVIGSDVAAAMRHHLQTIAAHESELVSDHLAATLRVVASVCLDDRRTGHQCPLYLVLAVAAGVRLPSVGLLADLKNDANAQLA